ncbi:OFA family MFS transporter [Alkalicella caledoniensis]|uniref:OFA family MFS transporter n=1 Tax=Alkalicella caledoniensis TaxID=2731377 RepID=A0A7G9W4W5_ALKCA|nr:OFA family MFS transporter [Alkalicella caledoniensis]QNO13727.1 OFA family MFS transporter [Alkalicella caledoniensis]
MSKSIQRWMILLGTVLLQFSIGAIYSWSLFNQPLAEKFGWQESEIVFTFGITVFMFAFATLFSGPLQDKIGPKIVASIGGILYGTGLYLTSTATTLLQLYLYYGVVVGLGVGFVYVCPLTTCLKWFPDRKGFITGVSLGAFGTGSLIFKPLIEYLLANYGVSNTFQFLAIIFFVIIIIGAQLLKNPPNISVYVSKNDNAPVKKSYTVVEMIKTKSFYILWFMLLLGATSGLLVIGLAKDIGIELAGLTPTVAANAVAVTAIFNTSGRLGLGALSDKLGRLNVVLITFILTSITMLFMSIFPLNFITYMISIAIITLCFGGLMTIYPTISGEYYGIKNLGANYAIIFQAYGISALLGPALASYIGDLRVTFAVAGGLSIVGAALCLWLIRIWKNKEVSE